VSIIFSVQDATVEASFSENFYSKLSNRIVHSLLLDLLESKLILKFFDG